MLSSCFGCVCMCVCQDPTFVAESSDQKKLFDCRNLSIYWDTNMAGDVESGPELVVRPSSLPPSLLTPTFPHSHSPSLLIPTFPPHSHLSLLTPTFPHSHLPSSLSPSLLTLTFPLLTNASLSPPSSLLPPLSFCNIQLSPVHGVCVLHSIHLLM